MDYKKLTTAGLFCAVLALATVIVKIPIPGTSGYVNFGDGVIFLSALFLANPLCAVAAGVGSALADLILGAGIYVLPTLLIKGLMGFIAAAGFKMFKDGKKLIFVFFFAETIMVLGYFIFEIFAFGIGTALVAIPFNIIQGVFGVFAGYLLIKAVQKSGIKTLTRQ